MHVCIGEHALHLFSALYPHLCGFPPQQPSPLASSCEYTCVCVKCNFRQPRTVSRETLYFCAKDAAAEENPGLDNSSVKTKGHCADII